MILKTINKQILNALLMSLVVSVSNYAQIVPFYPIEVFFNPCGYTNQIPGCKPDLYTTFSSLKLVLNKDLPSTPKLSNTITFVGNLSMYHSITKARDYVPFSLNPVIRMHYFMNDIFTPCIEFNGNMEFLPGTDASGNLFQYTNYRFRINPYHYLIITPNIIFQQTGSYGRSYNTAKTGMKNIDNTPARVSRDYYILKYEATAIYLSKIHTRFFLSPYCFQNQYLDIAVAKNGKIDLNAQKLKEVGYGCAIGLRYSTFTWGFAEAVFEYERNMDQSSGANSYEKFKLNTKWENQYFTERFGYGLMFVLIKHNFNDVVFDFTQTDINESELGQLEIRADIMPIFNLNRNVSIRPEFDFLYKDLPGKNDMKKFRYWLHLHVLF